MNKKNSFRFQSNYNEIDEINPIGCGTTFKKSKKPFKKTLPNRILEIIIIIIIDQITKRLMIKTVF